MSRIKIDKTFEAYPKGAKETFAANRVLAVGTDVDTETADQWVEKGLAHRLAEKAPAPKEKAE